jgi:hypothetical protein
MEIAQESAASRSLLYGHVTVGLIPVRLSEIQNPMSKGAMLQSDPNNSSTIFVGKEGVSADGTSQGFPIGVGMSIVLPIDRLDTLWLAASTDGNNLAWISV